MARSISEVELDMTNFLTIQNEEHRIQFKSDFLPPVNLIFQFTFAETTEGGHESDDEEAKNVRRKDSERQEEALNHLRFEIANLNKVIVDQKVKISSLNEQVQMKDD